MNRFGFDERLAMSDDVAKSMRIGDLLVCQIPGAVAAFRSHVSNDRNGTDWWVEMESSSRHLSVDVKARGKDFEPEGYDDYALETYSVVETKAPGWTRDPTKQTDFILWVWKDTGRWALLPFQPLCLVFCNRWEEWRERFRTEPQETVSRGKVWHSECVFVPRKVLWREMFMRFSGEPDA